MKKLLLTAALMLAAVAMHAQVFNVASVTRVNTDVCVDQPVISADGSFVVAYSPIQGAIMKIDADGNSTSVVKGDGLYNLRLSADGSNVIFSTPSFDKNHMRKVSLQAADIATGSVTTIVKPSRRLNSGYGVDGSTVTAVENGKVRTKALSGSAVKASPVASINYGHLDVTVGGKTTSIDPQGRGSYIWPSVSPDGTKVCYWLVGRGCFICNLDGSNPVSLGALRAPVWAGNDVIVGMDIPEPSEQNVTASAIKARRISDGATQVLTSYDLRAMYPSASADGSRIAFSTPEGQLHIITLTK